MFLDAGTFINLLSCSVIIRIFQMCLVLYVITLPGFIILTLYDNPLWFVLLLLTITPCINGPLLSLYMATVEPLVKEIEYV